MAKAAAKIQAIRRGQLGRRQVVDVSSSDLFSAVPALMKRASSGLSAAITAGRATAVKRTRRVAELLKGDSSSSCTKSGSSHSSVAAELEEVAEARLVESGLQASTMQQRSKSGLSKTFNF